jgi:GNAT superfamily N-acetyltransferase
MGAARWPGDADAEHYAAEAPEGGEVVGVASVFSAPLGPDGPTGQLRGMAVAPAARGGGVGLKLLRAVEAAHPEGLWCNARVSALGFYEGAGWRVISEAFEIPGVGPHVKMRWDPS